MLALASGGMIDIGSDALSNAHLSALISAPFGGQWAGDALAAVAFGDVNPSGRLTTSWYTSAAVGNLSRISDYNMTRRTYRFAPETDFSFVFGHGLSFSTFTYSALTISPSAPGPCDTIFVSTEVTLASGPPGVEVPQLYLSFPGASVPLPRLRLANFDKIAFAGPGDSVRVNLTITPSHNAVMVAGTFTEVIEPGARTVWLGASSSTTAPGSTGAFTIAGAPMPLSACGAAATATGADAWGRST